MIPSLSNARHLNIAQARNVRAELEKFYEQPIAKVSLELILSLATVMFFAVFALRPTLATMTELTREIEDKRKVNEALTKKVAALATAQSEYLTYQERFTVLDEAIHDQPTLETALFYLEYLVRRENISLDSLRIETFPLGGLSTVSGGGAGVDSSATNKEIGVYAIQTSFEGDYQNIVTFFQVIEAIRPLFAVESFTLTTGSDPENPTLLKANATIFMYGYRTPAVVEPLPRTQSPETGGENG